MSAQLVIERFYYLASVLTIRECYRSMNSISVYFSLKAPQTYCTPFGILFVRSVASLLSPGELIAFALLNLGTAGVSKTALRFLAVPLTPLTGRGVLGTRPSNL